MHSHISISIYNYGYNCLSYIVDVMLVEEIILIMNYTDTDVLIIMIFVCVGNVLKQLGFIQSIIQFLNRLKAENIKNKNKKYEILNVL